MSPSTPRIRNPEALERQRKNQYGFIGKGKGKGKSRWSNCAACLGSGARHAMDRRRAPPAGRSVGLGPVPMGPHGDSRLGLAPAAVPGVPGAWHHDDTGPQ